jgi:hypothetical protein
LQLHLALTQQTNNGAFQAARISSRVGNKQLHKLTEKHLPPANSISSKAHTSIFSSSKGFSGQLALVCERAVYRPEETTYVIWVRCQIGQSDQQAYIRCNAGILFQSQKGTWRCEI